MRAAPIPQTTESTCIVTENGLINSNIESKFILGMFYIYKYTKK